MMRTMVARTYGQRSGLARAADIVGGRWALLIVRDLLRGPMRFTDLRQALPRIPTNVLSARLKEFERNGVVRRRPVPLPTRSIVYELTDFGSELHDVVLSLDRWGGNAPEQDRP